MCDKLLAIFFKKKIVLIIEYVMGIIWESSQKQIILITLVMLAEVGQTIHNDLYKACPGHTIYINKLSCLSKRKVIIVQLIKVFVQKKILSLKQN